MSESSKKISSMEAKRIVNSLSGIQNDRVIHFCRHFLRSCVVCLLDPCPIQGLSLHGSQSLVHSRYGLRRSFRTRKKKSSSHPFFHPCVCNLKPRITLPVVIPPLRPCLGRPIDTLLAPRFGPSLDPVSLPAPIHHGMNVPPSLPSFLLDVPDRR